MENTDQFRNSISTVDDKGKRVWIFPKKPAGWYYNKRKIASYLLLFLLFAAPFISINDNPLILINILDRKFVFFGQVFWPQDLFVFALAMIIFVLFISLFTVIFGRLFCGWICPQTIFMEMVFRRIEYWIEGDWKQQKKLKSAPWGMDKSLKKTVKHLLFFLISFLIANTFLAYIIGYKDLFKIITDPPQNHVGGLTAILIFTTLFYLVFSKMREQVCTTVCPYGRLQGVLLDNKSMTVAYDYLRGENRGKIKKKQDRSQLGIGDCIDCSRCVHVCPTGIDIRNGTQMECINCTACMDECDFVMDKVGTQKGLIRYASIQGIEEKKGFEFTPRVIAYSSILLFLIGIMGIIIFNRSNVDTTILRTRGTLFQQTKEGYISNIYDVSLINKTNKKIPIIIRVMGNTGRVKMVGNDLNLKPHEETKGKFMVVMQKGQINSRKMDLIIGVYGNNKLIDEIETTFIGPYFE